MITRLELKNFKSFGTQDNVAKLGPLTLIIGPNASGKSNLRDGIRFLHGISRSYSLADTLGAKYGEGGELQWKGVRGGTHDAVFFPHFGQAAEADFQISVDTTLRVRHKKSDVVRIIKYSYLLRVLTMPNPGQLNQFLLGPRITAEHLRESGQIKDWFCVDPDKSGNLMPDRTGPMYVRYRKSGNKKFIGPVMPLPRTQPAITQMPLIQKVEATVKLACLRFLKSIGSVQFLDLDPQSLRRPSLPGQTRLGDRGENLSSVLQAICLEENSKESLMEWIRNLTPLDVVDLHFDPVSADGKIQVFLIERNRSRISAEIASDGTLRFLAFAAAILGPDPAKIYFIEEIETGIHPNRIHLLFDLLKYATKKIGIQVLATTHSPSLLKYLDEKTRNDVLIMTRGGEDTRIRRLGDLKDFPKEKGVAGELLESGWFEDIAAYLDGEDDPE